MGWKFKSKKVVLAIAEQLKQRRKDRYLTVVNVEGATGINRGQLSRFERGDFKTASENLQKICKYFQISLKDEETIKIGGGEAIGIRLERFAAISASHRAAAEDILRALDKLK